MNALHFCNATPDTRIFLQTNTGDIHGKNIGTFIEDTELYLVSLSYSWLHLSQTCPPAL